MNNPAPHATASHTPASAIAAWCARRTGPAATDTTIKQGWETFLDAADRELTTAAQHPAGQFPHVTEQGRWQLLPAEARSDDSGPHYDHGNWTAGFRAGIAWLHSLGTGAAASADIARGWLQQLTPRAQDHTTHDLGFLFFPSAALPDLLAAPTSTVTAADTAPALAAARTLAARWNPRTGLLQAFGPVGAPKWAGTSTIDTMMNLPLLWWAARRGEDPLLFDIARRHARSSARLYFRPDGSTFHLLHLDPISGAVHNRGTFQGASDDSCWSRGQAWAVCGMAWAYAATGEPELLQAAARAAAYYFDRLPDDGVPPWDFTADDKVPDASASAAAALGCLILADTHPDPDAAAEYQRAGRALAADIGGCVNRAGDVDGILLRSTYSLPHRRGVDAATGFGDFYAGLALACAAGTAPTSQLTGRGAPARA